MKLKGQDFQFSPIFQNQMTYLGQTKIQYTQQIIQQNPDKMTMLFITEHIDYNIFKS